MYIDGERIKLNINSSKSLSLNDILNEDIEYVFRGNFSAPIVAGILDLAKSTFLESRDNLKVKAKLYYIMGESLQNIAKHHSESFLKSPDKYSLFAIHRRNFKYYITTGNLIEVEDINTLKQKIDKINSMEYQDLKVYSRETRSGNDFTERVGGMPCYALNDFFILT